MGPTWSKKRILGKFRSFRGVHGRGDVSLPQFIVGVVCLCSYGRGDPLRDIAHRGLQNTNGFRPLRSSPFVICHGMVTGLGIKKPLDYSVFSAAAAAFLLAFWEPDRFALDKLLNRFPKLSRRPK
jgi:hypothetical protein